MLEPEPLLAKTHLGFSFNPSLTTRLKSTRYHDSLKNSVNLLSSDLKQREAFLYPSITTATETLLTTNHAESNASVVKVPLVEVLSCSRNAPEIQKPKSANTR